MEKSKQYQLDYARVCDAQKRGDAESSAEIGKLTLQLTHARAESERVRDRLDAALVNEQQRVSEGRDAEMDRSKDRTLHQKQVSDQMLQISHLEESLEQSLREVLHHKERHLALEGQVAAYKEKCEALTLRQKQGLAECAASKEDLVLMKKRFQQLEQQHQADKEDHHQFKLRAQFEKEQYEVAAKGQKKKRDLQHAAKPDIRGGFPMKPSLFAPPRSSARGSARGGDGLIGNESSPSSLTGTSEGSDDGAAHPKFARSPRGRTKITKNSKQNRKPSRNNASVTYKYRNDELDRLRQLQKKGEKELSGISSDSGDADAFQQHPYASSQHHQKDEVTYNLSLEQAHLEVCGEWSVVEPI